jgi:hypothetical protein
MSTNDYNDEHLQDMTENSGMNLLYSSQNN